MKIDPITFEKIMSFRPDMSSWRFGTEPPLRDLILNHYGPHFSAEDADELTKDYIAKLYEQFGETK